MRLALALLTFAVVAPPVGAATPEEVERAIARGKAHLYAAQQNGTWDVAIPHDDQWGGRTAIATYALLAAGERRTEPKLAKAIEFLKTAEIKGIYALGLRAQVWPFLEQTADVRAAVKLDGDLLVKSIKPPGPAAGMFNYFALDAKARYDHSVSQYGVLGLWACARLGYEVPAASWKAIDEAWRANQEADGGWSYIASLDAPKASMTAAGVATLLVTQDHLQPGDAACAGNAEDAHVERGVRWMTEHFKGVNNLYTWYGVERVGVAGGHKYFGTTDWYAVGAERIVRSQARDGGWVDVPNTCFALLFLCRGRAPVVLNKLEYEIASPGVAPRPARWNQRPRDAANFSRWLGGQLERDLNWQVVNLKVDADDLHDAPILYVAGDEPLQFSAADERKLRAFAEQGGVILGNADCASEAFAKSFEALGQKLFPSCAFRDLPAGHVIFAGPFPRSKWNDVPVVRGLGNGARELMLLLPAADVSKLWQTGAYAGREAGHQLVANVLMYAVDRRGMRVKGQSYLVRPVANVRASRRINVARLAYAGNWDPEPAGWRQLAARVHNEKVADLDVKTVTLGDGKLLAGKFSVAHLTGTERVTLPATALAELKTFVDGGGTLIVDACGGASEFTDALAAQLSMLFDRAPLELLPPAHPAFVAAGRPASAATRPASPAPAGVTVSYRPFARKVLGDLDAPRVRGLTVRGRTGVFISGEDLSTGLVGMPVDGVRGYQPESAAALMRSMILYAADGAATPGVKTAPRP